MKLVSVIFNKPLYVFFHFLFLEILHITIEKEYNRKQRNN